MYRQCKPIAVDAFVIRDHHSVSITFTGAVAMRPSESAKPSNMHSNYARLCKEFLLAIRN